MYVRTLNSGDSPADRYDAFLEGMPGGHDSLDPLEKQGRALFRGKGRCINCHRGSALLDNDFHNILTVDQMSGIVGLGGQTDRAIDLGRLKTPTLRNIAQTRPFFHDGHAETLADVLDHYNRGGQRGDGAPSPGEVDQDLLPLMLTATELAALDAYLLALSGTSPE